MGCSGPAEPPERGGRLHPPRPEIAGLSREKTWTFVPKAKEGRASGLATWWDGPRGEERRAPHHGPAELPGGKVAQVREGAFKVDEVVVTLDSGEQIRMLQTCRFESHDP